MSSQLDVKSELGISGLFWTPKNVVTDERGAVKLMIKEGQFDFPIGEVYFSIIKPGVVKGWKFHNEMAQRFCVPSGEMNFVFVDRRENSPTFGAICQKECGDSEYGLLTVPPQIWYSFKCISPNAAIIANAASIPRSAGESESVELDKFSYYRWK